MSVRRFASACFFGRPGSHNPIHHIKEKSNGRSHVPFPSLPNLLPAALSVSGLHDAATANDNDSEPARLHLPSDIGENLRGSNVPAQRYKIWRDGYGLFAVMSDMEAQMKHLTMSMVANKDDMIAQQRGEIDRLRSALAVTTDTLSRAETYIEGYNPLEKDISEAIEAARKLLNG